MSTVRMNEGRRTRSDSRTNSYHIVHLDFRLNNDSLPSRPANWENEAT